MAGFALLCFVVLLVGLTTCTSIRRPLSAGWRLPVLFLCCGLPFGAIISSLTRDRDERMARAALLMQTVGMLFAVFAMGDR